MIQVMIIEDEPTAALVLKKMIERSPAFQVASVCGSFSAAIEAYLQTPVPLCFVDVDLAGESGLICAKAITKLNPDVKLIFATAHSEFMADAFEIYAFDYLVKPFDSARVRKTLARLEQQLDAATPLPLETEKLLLKSKDRTVFLDTADILLAEHNGGTTAVHTTSGIYTTSLPLKDIELRLPKTQFLRCHKSYIVRLSQIESVEPYGRWTYILRLKSTDSTALCTAEKYEFIRSLFEPSAGTVTG